ERVERDEERIRHDRRLVRQAVEERRLSRIRVSDERNGRHGVFLPALAQLRTPLTDVIDLTLNGLDAHADPPAIGFKLRLAGPARTDAAAQARERRARANQPRQ